MKRWLKIIIPVFVLTFILLGSAIQVQAGTIISLEATPGTEEITVSGVAGNDVLSVMILLYDSTETNVLQMQSVAVDDNHAYEYTFTVEEGTYVVKAADYEGGTFESKTVSVAAATEATTTTEATTATEASTSTSDPSPNTGDNSNLLLWILGLIGSATILTGISVRKNK